MAAPDPRLEQAVALGAAMLEAAAGGDWERLARLQAERETLLRGEFPRGAATADLLRRLLADNQAIEAHVAQARGAVAGELGLHLRTHKALRSYVGNGG